MVTKLLSTFPPLFQYSYLLQYFTLIQKINHIVASKNHLSEQICVVLQTTSESWQVPVRAGVPATVASADCSTRLNYHLKNNNNNKLVFNINNSELAVLLQVDVIPSYHCCTFFLQCVPISTASIIVQKSNFFLLSISTSSPFLIQNKMKTTRSYSADMFEANFSVVSCTLLSSCLQNWRQL